MGVLAVPGTGFLNHLSCEFLAVRDSWLALLCTSRVQDVVIEGDSQGVFAALESQVDDFSMEGVLVDEAKLLINCFDSCLRNFTPREGNKAAHKVARTALSFQFPTYWWHMVPDWLVHDIISNKASM